MTNPKVGLEMCKSMRLWIKSNLPEESMKDSKRTAEQNKNLISLLNSLIKDLDVMTYDKNSRYLGSVGLFINAAYKKGYIPDTFFKVAYSKKDFRSYCVLDVSENWQKEITISWDPSEQTDHELFKLLQNLGIHRNELYHLDQLSDPDVLEVAKRDLGFKGRDVAYKDQYRKYLKAWRRLIEENLQKQQTGPAAQKTQYCSHLVNMADKYRVRSDKRKSDRIAAKSRKLSARSRRLSSLRRSEIQNKEKERQNPPSSAKNIKSHVLAASQAAVIAAALGVVVYRAIPFIF